MDDLKKAILQALDEAKARMPVEVDPKATFGRRKVKQPKAADATDQERAEWTGENHKLPQGALERIKKALDS